MLGALAAWRAASASAKGARGSEAAATAALLNIIPLVYPWIKGDDGTGHVKNRGATEALGISWRLVAEDETVVVAEGRFERVLGSGVTRPLFRGDEAAVVKSAMKEGQHFLICEYACSPDSTNTMS